MKKAILALAAAASLAAVAPQSARADCVGCAVGAGVIGGLAAGAIIGSAIAQPRPYYYQPAPVYVAPPSAVYVDDGPVCHIERHQYWDGYGYRWRRVQVCE